nr:hypothetical protein BSM_18100 [uncultured archaeon]
MNQNKNDLSKYIEIVERYMSLNSFTFEEKRKEIYKKCKSQRIIS